MRVAISVDRPFHSVQLANSLAGKASSVGIYSSAPRRFFRGLDDTVRTHLVPSPLNIVGHVLKAGIPASLLRYDSVLFDALVKTTMGVVPDLYAGWAGQALITAQSVKKRGGRFTLDRACPHRDFQEALVARESERLGVTYSPQPRWFRDRQLEEYELADNILVPSNYTARTFPDSLQHKLVKAPLLGRCAEPEFIRKEANAVFTVGVVGGSAVRKGYLYLLRAWKKLALPNAKLMLRAGDLTRFPILRELLNSALGVEFVDYVPNISDFYQKCDVFVLPSVDDGFGMALIEAMLNGCACITTSNTGASELISNGHDGIVIDPANEEQLAEAILRFYEDADLRTTIGRAARVRAREISASGLYDTAISVLLSDTIPTGQ